VTPLIPASDVGITIVTLVVSVVAVAVFFYVGARLLRRESSPRSRLASVQFSIWFLGLGAAVAAGRLELALALVNVLPYAAALTFSLVNVVIESVYLWGLVGSLVYVYTGRYYLVWLGGLYALFYVVSVYAIFAQGPYAVTVASGTPALLYVNPVNSGLALALQLIVLIPEGVGACLYLSVLARTSDLTVQWRISLVGTGILFWVAVHAFVPNAGYMFILLKTVLDLVPAVLALIGVLPPAWIRRRFGIAATGAPEEYYRAGPASP
jgi:hypothetical protein